VCPIKFRGKKRKLHFVRAISRRGRLTISICCAICLVHVSLIVFCLYVYILSRFHSSSFVLLFPTLMCDFASPFFRAICICVFMRNEDETRIRVVNL